MVQSVAWVTELKNTQSCLFYLSSILCFLKWEKGSTTDYTDNTDSLEQNSSGDLTEPPTRRFANSPNRLFVLSLFFFILATLSKPSVVMLPIVLALCIWWRRRGLCARRNAALDRGGLTRLFRWPDLLALAPFALISTFAGVWTIWEQKFHAHAIGSEWAQTWPERLIIAGRAIWFYLAKLFWPDPLIFIYPRWEIHSSELTAYLPLLAAFVGLLVLWLVPAKWSRAVFFAAAYYLVSLFPVLSFFNVFFFRYSFVSDHFQYLASMGPLALVGAGITEGFRRLVVPVSLGRAAVFLRLVLCSGLLLLVAALTWQQSAAYHDLITLYTTTLANNSGCWMAHYNLGIALHERGESDQAITHYRQAI